MCQDPFFAQKICFSEGYIENSMPSVPCTGFFFALFFSRLERGPDPLVLSPMIVNWLLISSAYFEPTFSTPDTFQVPVLIEIYDKARVIWRIKAGFRIFLIDFMPFFIFCIGVGSIAVTIKIYMAFFVS